MKTRRATGESYRSLHRRTGSRLRICYVVFDIAPAGAETVVRNLALSMAERGHEVTIYALRRRADGISQAVFGAIVNHPSIRLREGPHCRLRNPIRVLHTLLNLRRTIKEFRTEIVHSHGEYADLATLLSTRFLPTVRIRTAHNERYFQDQVPCGAVVEHLVNLCGFRAVIGISQTTRATNARSARCVKIHNGIFANDAPTPKSRPEHTLARVAIIGRLTEQKGQLAFVHAMLHRYVPPPEIPFTLELVGDGPHRREIERIASPLGDRLILRGFISDQEEIYRDLDAILIPSKYEGLSTVMVEAVARCIPVISYPVSGASEVLSDGRFGQIVPNATAMMEAVEHRAFPRIRTEDVQKINQRFSIVRSARNHERLYMTCVN